MDKKKSMLNVFVAILFKIAILLFSILAKRSLIINVGNEANGLNSLYLSIIGILSITELGVGSAIAFCMYEPIVNDKKEIVAALYGLFTKLYYCIGTIILIIGLIVMPILPILTKGYETGPSMYIAYLIMLVSVVMNYLFSAKLSLINAHRNNYITTTITSSCLLLQNILQMVVLFIFKSFEIYLICRIISVLIQWILTDLYVKKNYKDIMSIKSKIDEETKKKVIKSTKAMFMHKVGSLLVNTVDSLVISTFIGVIVLGKYSNYITIASGMTGLLCLIFTSLTSIVGHFCAKEDNEKKNKYFNFFFALNFMIGTIFYLGYYAVIDDVVGICFGYGLEIDRSVVFVTSVNYFVQYMRQAVLLFRDATGTFYNDRWKPLFEGIANLVLSIILVQFIGMAGVIVATIATNIFICHVIEPYVLYKNVFKESPKKYYVQNYLYILIFVLLVIAQTLLMQDLGGTWKNLLINGSISVAIALIPISIIFIINKDLRSKCINLVVPIILKLKRKLINQKNS